MCFWAQGCGSSLGLHDDLSIPTLPNIYGDRSLRITLEESWVKTLLGIWCDEVECTTKIYLAMCWAGLDREKPDHQNKARAGRCYMSTWSAPTRTAHPPGRFVGLAQYWCFNSRPHPVVALFQFTSSLEKLFKLKICLKFQNCSKFKISPKFGIVQISTKNHSKLKIVRNFKLVQNSFKCRISFKFRNWFKLKNKFWNSFRFLIWTFFQT
jgi:hypothetical protein